MKILFPILFLIYNSLLFSAESSGPLILKHSLTNSQEPFTPWYHISIEMPHLKEMKRTGVRRPKIHPIDQLYSIRADFIGKREPLKCHLCILTTVCIVRGLCTIYETNTRKKTFTLQLSTLTNQLDFDSTEAYRNLDYFFDGQTGLRSKSWAEKAQEEYNQKKMIFNFLTIDQLKATRTKEHNKIREYRHIFKEGIQALPHDKETPYLLPERYVHKLELIEQDLKRRPNPFIVDYLHTKIAALEEEE
jgi:hypothetical protein